MSATNIVPRDKQPTINSIFTAAKGLKLLKTVAFYGPTASGKTNIALAFDFMRQFVLNSANTDQLTDKIPVNRFRLRAGNEDNPSSFSIDLVLDGIIYYYGFDITPEHITSEWLSYTPTPDPDYFRSLRRLFERDGDQITIYDEFVEGLNLAEPLPKNALLLSLVARSGGTVSGKIVDWFSRLQIISRVNHPDDIQAMQTHLREKKNKDAVLRFVQKMNEGIVDLQSDPAPMPPDSNADTPRTRTIHSIYTAGRDVVGSASFSLDEESAGTQRLLCLALPIMSALEQGHLIFIDDLSAHLNPHSIRAIVELFTRKQQNPHNAQLIFTTHDTSLLTSLRWRREQIYLVEKDYGDTGFFSMAGFTRVNMADLERDYIMGRYRVLPSPTLDILPLGDEDSSS